MNVILVEDDEYKANQIKEFLINKGNEVVIKKSYKTGIEAIVNGVFDLVLLDMTIPTFEISPLHPSSRNRKYGGRDILNEMHRKEIRTPAIVITQYSIFGDGEMSLDELDEELMNNYSEIYRGIVFYNASVLDWQANLTVLINNDERKDN